MAEISDKRLKAFNTAITYYDELAGAYPEDSRCIVALEEAARLHNKLREPEQAAAKLVRIAAAFPDYKKSADHLMEAAGIYESKLKDYQRALDNYQLITTQYPDTRHARTAAGKIEKLKAKLEW
jgi:TolA-binding protein